MLSDLQAKKAKPREKAYKLADGKGLHLFVTPSGGKLWRFRYSYDGKEKLLSFGPYPEVTLVVARERCEEARARLRDGFNPGNMKQEKKKALEEALARTFERVSRQWYEFKKETWTPRHKEDVISSLERDVFPAIGGTPIRDVGSLEILNLLRAIEARSATHTARRVQQRISAVFVYAMALEMTASNPAAAVRGIMAPLRKGKQPAIVTLPGAREMLARVEDTPSAPANKLALRLLALTAVRPGTLLATPWTEFDKLNPLDPVWQIPAVRLKLLLAMKEGDARDHLVPLSRQAMETIEALRALTGEGRFVVPNNRTPHKPASENTLGYLLHRAGYHGKHVPHGWRATFSTILNERNPADARIIDFMLGHVPKDKVEAAYNRALYLKERKELAQIWADLIMEGRPPAMSLLDTPYRVPSLG